MAEHDVDNAEFSDDEVVDLPLDDSDWDDIEVLLCVTHFCSIPGAVGLRTEWFSTQLAGLQRS